MANSDKNIRITANRDTTALPKIIFTGQSNNPIALNVLDDNTISFEGSAGQLFSINNNLSSGYIFSINDISGIPSFRVNADGTVGIAEFLGNVGIGLTNPAYKLQISGSAGISGTANISGVLTLSSTTGSGSTSTGALVVSGGVGIGGSIFSSSAYASSLSGVVFNNGAITNTGTITSTGVMSISNSSTTAFQVRDGSNNPAFVIDTIGDIISLPVAIASTTTGTGSLVVAGGVGIGGTLNVGSVNIVRDFTHTPNQTTIGGASGWVASTASTFINPSSFRYLNNKYIGIGGTYIYYSDDMLNWSSVNVPNLDPTRSIADIIYGEGKYVFVQNYTANAGYSTNLTNWTNVAIGYNNWFTLAYGNGTFVVTSGGSPYAVSSDGINWSNNANATHGFNTDIKFINGYFYSSSSGSLERSTDGITWQTCNIPALPYGLAYGNGLYVGGVYNSGTIVYSYDGLNFLSYIGSSLVHKRPYYFNGVYYITTQNNSVIRYSTDGFNWLNSTGFPGNVDNMVYAQGKLYVGSGATVWVTNATPGRFEVNPLRTGTLDDVEIGRLSPNNANFIDVSVNNNLNVSSQYSSISPLNGALTVAGGVGIGGSLYVASATAISGVTINAGVITGSLTGTATTSTYSHQSGYAITTGSSGTATTANNVRIASAGNSNSSHLITFTPNSSSSGSAISSDSTFSFNPSTEILSVSGIAITSTTASTSTTTGSLIVSGGVGIGNTLYVAGRVDASNYKAWVENRTLSSLDTCVGIGTFYVNNGAHNLLISLNVSDGGYGVAKNYTITTYWNAGGWRIVAPTSSFGPYSGNDFQLEAYQLGDNLTLRARSLSAGSGNNLQVYIQNTGRTNAIFSPYNTSTSESALTIYHYSAFVSQEFYVFKINSSTASTSTSTGALVVTGGVGIGQSLFTSSSYASSISGVTFNNGAITNTGTITSTGVMSISNSSTTAFAVRDGSNSSKFNVDTVGGIVSVLSSTASTNSSTGALVVSGGVGIGGTLNVNGSVNISNSLDLVNTTTGIATTWIRSFVGTGATITYLAYANNLYVGVGYSAITSTDGINWTTRTLPHNLSSVAYGNGIWTGVRVSSATGATSTDGTSWTSFSLPNSRTWRRVVFGNGIFVTVAYSSNIAAYSTNGYNWTETTLPTGNLNYIDLTFGGGYFVAVATGSSTAVCSTDGINWSTITLFSVGGYNITNISYGNGYFYITFNGGGSIHSRDLINWSSALGSVGTLYNISAYNNGAFAVVGLTGLSTYIVTNDLTSSTQMNLPGPQIPNTIVAGDRNFIAGYGQTLYTFPIPNNSISIFPNTTGEINNVEIGNTKPASGSFSNIYSQGLVAFGSTARSISPYTGALVVNGGVGIGGSLYVASATAISGVTINAGVITGSLSGTATTSTYSHQSGYAITSSSSGTATTSNYSHQSGYAITSGSSATATTATYSHQSGYATTSGLATTATYSHQSGYATTSGLATTATYSHQSGYATTSGLATTATYANQSGYGITAGLATTATYAHQSGYAITSGSSGSATTANNINVANALTNSAHTLLFSPTATGSGVAVSSNSTLSYNPSSFVLSTSGLAITATTASSSTSNGALQVAGGVGISGRLSFNQAAFGTTGIATNPTMAMIGNTGDPIFLSILEDNTISFEGSQGQLFSITPNLSTGYIYSVNDITGIPLLRANANANVTANEYAGNFGIGLSNPGYKLHVVGSVGFTSTTASTSTTTGTLVVSGGVGIGGSLYVNSPSNISSVIINNGVITGNLTGTATTSGFATTASYSNQAGYAITAGSSNTSGYATTSGLATTATYSYQSGYGLTSGFATTASYAYQSGYGLTSGFATTASYSHQAGYAITAGSATTAFTAVSTTSVSVASAGNSNLAHPILITNNPSSGSAVSSDSTFTFNPSTEILSVSGISVTSTTASTSFSSGALVVSGGVGIGGSLFVNGDLTINGTTTTINSVTLSVDDKNIELGSVSSPSDVTAEGGGITLKGATDKFINWYSGVGWSSSESWNLVSGNSYKINNASVLNATTLGTGVTNSSLTSLGTITTGVWAGTLITANYGGVGLTTPFTVGDILYANTSTTWGRLTAGTSGHLLSSTGTGSTPSYVNPNTLTVGSATTASNLRIAVASSNLSHPVLFTPGSSTSGSAVSSDNTFSFNSSTEILSVSGVAITSTTSSSGSTTGALTVAGGVGIGGTVNIAGDETVLGRLYYSQSTVGVAGTSTIPSISFIGQDNNPITLSVLTDNTLSFEGSSGQLFSINNNLSSGTIFSVNDISGIPIIRANANGTLSMGEFTGTVGVGLTNPSFKFHVSGSAGFSGTIYATGNVSLASNTASTSTTNGALTIAGGVGIGGSLYVASATAISGVTINAGVITGSLTGTASTATYSHQSGYAITSGFATTASYAYQSGYGLTSGSSGLATTASNINIVSATTNASHPVLFTPSAGTASGAALSTESTFVYNPSTDILSVSGLAVTSGTASTSSTTGALVVQGGVGIGQSLFTSSSYASSISGVVFNNGAITNTGTITSTGVMSISNSSTTAFSVKDGSNDTKFNVNTIGGIVSVSSSTASTNTSTGAFTVSGGVGIGGTLNANSVVTYNRLQNQSFSGTAIGATTNPSVGFGVGHDKTSYGNGVFVSTSSWGAYNANYSTDGVNWTAVSLPVNQAYPVNFYGNGYFVLGGVASTTVLYSTNGQSWSQVSIGNTLSRSNGVYGNGKYVMVGTGATYFYSSNITTWTANTLPYTADWRIAYGNGMFVALAYGNGTIIYSYDAINWSISNTVSNSHTDLYYGNGKFVVTTWSGWGVKYSTDGINWLSVSNPGGSYDGNLLTVRYGNGVYAISDYGQTILSSTDGITWDPGVYKGGGSSYISYGNNRFAGGRWIDGPTNTVTLDPKFTGEINNVRIGAVTPASGDFTNLSSTGSANLVGTVNANNLNIISKINQTPVSGSFSGTTGWTSPVLIASDNNYALAFGNGLFVQIRRTTNSTNFSSDGRRWTGSTMPFTGDWNGVVWGVDKFVAVAGLGTTGAYSGNGIAWTSMNMPSTAQGWIAVTYGDDKFVAVGNTSTAAYSSDGITWSGSSIANTTWTAVTYGNGTFVAVAGFGRSAAYSHDGIAWNFVNLPTNQSFSIDKKITYGNGYFVVTSYNTLGYDYSRDGVNWSTVNVSGLNRPIIYGNGIYSVLNYSNAYYSSDITLTSNWFTSNTINSTDWIAFAYGNNRFVATSYNTGAVAQIDGPSNTLNLHPKFTGDIDNVRIGAKQPAAAEFTNLAAQQPVRFTANTRSTSPTTGALVVVGGVGIGGSLYVSSATAISGVTINAGVITGSLTGTASTATYSHQSGYAITSGSSGAATTATYSHQSGYATTSGFATTATYSYQSGYGLTSGLATTATYSHQSGYATTSGLATTATYSYQSGYGITAGFATSATSASIANTSYSVNVNAASANASHFLIFSPTATGSGVALSSESALVYNPSTDILSVSGLAVTSGTASTSATTGALVVTGGVGIGLTLTVGLGISTPVISAPANLLLKPGVDSTTGIQFTRSSAALPVLTIDTLNSRVGIGLTNPEFDFEVNGSISATTKSFVIEHPTKQGMKLRYGSLEGPENGVYVRGELKDNNTIILPDYWSELVDESSITVHLTPIGNKFVYVKEIKKDSIIVGSMFFQKIHCYYSVWAERKDVPKLKVEF